MMDTSRLIQGNPYIYNGVGGCSKVLYDSMVQLVSGDVVYHFRFRRDVKVGFVNLTEEQVEKQISAIDGCKNNQ